MLQLSDTALSIELLVNIFMHFAVLFTFYFIPCLLGSMINFCVKRDREGMKICLNRVIIYSFTPTIILTMIDTYIKLTREVNESLMIFLLGISFIFGLVSDEITLQFATLKNLMRKYRGLVRIIRGLKTMINDANSIGRDEDDDDDCDHHHDHHRHNNHN